MSSYSPPLCVCRLAPTGSGLGQTLPHSRRQQQHNIKKHVLKRKRAGTSDSPIMQKVVLRRTGVDKSCWRYNAPKKLVKHAAKAGRATKRGFHVTYPRTGTKTVPRNTKTTKTLQRSLAKRSAKYIEDRRLEKRTTARHTTPSRLRAVAAPRSNRDVDTAGVAHEGQSRTRRGKKCTTSGQRDLHRRRTKLT